MLLYPNLLLIALIDAIISVDAIGVFSSFTTQSFYICFCFVALVSFCKYYKSGSLGVSSFTLGYLYLVNMKI